ncbi:MAG: hypothetical protein D6703_01380 [Zetaproteobacteria bacterium]|nr:MAG: hypothetical protein D6703_01380 [Zetaproteobacteria bacterium]
MAGRDFAKVRSPSRRGRKAASMGSKRQASAADWISLFVLPAIAFGVGYWWGNQGQGKVFDGDEHQRLVMLEKQLEEKRLQLAQLEQENARLKQEKEKNPATVDELTFYRELPRQSVTPAPLAEVPVLDPAKRAVRHAEKHDDISHVIEAQMGGAAATGKGGYRIQVGSFRRRYDAESMMKHLRKHGFSTFIQSVDLGDKGQWHRVFVGPFHSSLLAEHAKQDLEKKVQLKGLVIRDGS